MSVEWINNAGAHCEHWYDNEPCCWCGDPATDDPDNAEETPCPENMDSWREQ